MLPAMNPEPQKIAKPTRTIIARPRRPIFGILDGVGRPAKRWMFNSLIRSLMLGFQYARKKNRGITIGSRFCIFREPVIPARFRAERRRSCPIQTPVSSEIFSGIFGSRARRVGILGLEEQ